MAPPHPRVENAFQAMRQLGITEDKVKPVLKRLLKLYDKNWDPIEDEYYRVLIDAIFESEEPQAPISSKKRGSPEAPNTSKEKEIVENQQDLTLVKEEMPDKIIPPLKRHRSNLQDQVSTVLCAAGSSALPSYDEPIGYVESSPLDVIYPEKPNGNGDVFSPKANGAGPSLIEKTNNADRVFTSSPENHTEHPISSNGFTSQLAAASTPGGEVKMFLTCDVSQLGEGFRMPVVDDVLKLAEDRFREKYNIQDPDFSIKKVMEAIGGYVLELGSERV